MSTPAQWVSARELGELSTLAPWRRMSSSSSAEPVMAMAACRARERPRSSGSSLSRVSATAQKPRAVEVAGQVGVCLGEGSDGAAVGADADAGAEEAAPVVGVDQVLGTGRSAGAGR